MAILERIIGDYARTVENNAYSKASTLKSCECGMEYFTVTGNAPTQYANHTFSFARARQCCILFDEKSSKTKSLAYYT